ncbi:DUF3800 domain-containing protein [Actinotignum sp. SLA_B059]|uniref:DUF3800 domain-containing protein n=1 Tax=Actinotignum sp. SLA_B059 TaxID=3083287 RepID=UPI002A817BC1|nr:DUF3800 domain-containing protein [Actinotignum sp. SLA_B059]MDY5127540.1 DUF3800 domain-containing protein [Actinotignum sp. SLA_B059]
MKHTLFIDESYGEGHFYIAGVLATDEQLADLNRRFAARASYYQIVNNLPHIPEFHGHSIMTGRDDWTALKRNFGSAIALLKRLTTEISRSGAAIFIEGVDTRRLNSRYKYPDAPYEVCLRNLLESVNLFLSNAGDTCRVIADSVPDSDTYAQRMDYYCSVTNPGYRRRQLMCIEGPMEFVDSRQHFGIQSADIVAYLHRRLVEGGSSSKETQRACARAYKPLLENIKTSRKWLP